MSDHEGIRSARDVDVDAERFLDAEVDEVVTRAVDLAPDGSVADIIDQRLEVPDDDES
jgi:hypothetical protein